ncbi:hypothetical protein ACJ73_00463 [Blastomyces percursus]|uniref:Uncharacterized protein n=1 Tax=Blastomyces percursus TaxID=1658174 RepID=A0A1J9QJ75_9EURO|nr:hypothetical protein ACJ73_00463 [Blastomyces percursus]
MIKGQIASGYDVVSRSCMSYGWSTSADTRRPRGGNRGQLAATRAIPDTASATQHKPGATALGGVGLVWLAGLKLWLEP